MTAPMHGESTGSWPDDLDDVDNELAATDHLFTDSLAHILAPPADLEQRTNVTIAQSLLNRSALGTAADLLTVGWHTVRLLARTHPENPSEHSR